MNKKLKLHGFNNLTKSLGLSLYRFACADTEKDRLSWLERLDAVYCAERLSGVMSNLAGYIGATVLSLSRQDYEPRGASAALLLAEGPMSPPQGEAILAHLDKSHITVHTYPEQHPDIPFASFRVDIDVATCGEITPLSALEKILADFRPDVATLDYRVRGFTRTAAGNKIFEDTGMSTIREYLEDSALVRFEARDYNLPEAGLYHTRFMLKDIDPAEHLIIPDMPCASEMLAGLRCELLDIFKGRNS